MFNYRHQLNTEKWSAIMIIILTLDYVKLTATKEVACFVPVFFNTAWTDRRPDFNVNMTFGDMGSIYSETRVTKEIAHPIAQLHIEQRDASNKPSTLYNITSRLCDLNAMLSGIPMIKQAFQTATKQGNYSLQCPMKPGFYIMSNLRVGNRSPILALLFRRRRRYTFTGGMFEELKNKTLWPLTTYNFSFKVVKKSCK